MSDFTEFVQDEMAERPSVAAIAATGSILVKANNPFSKDYGALAQGTSGQVLLSAGAGAVPVWSSDSTNWDTAYTHSQNNSQAHSDYLINNGSDETSGTLTAAAFFTTGDITIDSDSSLLKLGAEQEYTIGYDGDNAVHTLTTGDFIFIGDKVGVNTTTPEGLLTIRRLGDGLPTMGSELVTNGDFASDLSGWTVTGSDWVWDSGTVLHNIGNTTALYQGISITNGTRYQVGFDFTSPAGSVIITFGSMIGSYFLSGNQTYTFAFRATSTGTANLTFTPTSAFDGTINNITVKAVTSPSEQLILVEDVARLNIMEFRSYTNNMAIGVGSLAYNTTGYLNMGLGINALRDNITGFGNTGIGVSALLENLTGQYNTAIGYLALEKNIYGVYNTAVGFGAVADNTVSNYLVGVGAAALGLATGAYNTGVGVFTAIDITSGTRNTIVGYYSGRGITTGSGNVILGAQIAGLAANLQNTVVIGAGNNLVRLIIDSSGHVQIPYDGRKLEFGAAQDYSIQWNNNSAFHYLTAGSFWFYGGPLIVGDTTDFVEFEADGMMVMNGTATIWDDIRVNALSTKLPAIGAPSFTQFADDGAGSTGVFTYMFDDSSEDQVFFNIIIPHGYKLGSDLEPHVHWSPQTTNAGRVDWFLEYTISNLDGTFGNTSTVTMSDTGDGTINKSQVTDAAIIDGTSLTLAALLICRLSRNGGVGTDTLVGDAAFLEFDIHFEQDTIGSREDFTK